MSDQPDFDFVANLSALSDERRLQFYETLAHNLTLTITIRVIWDDSTRSDAAKVNAIRCINEIVHRVTSKITVTRRNLHEWTESDMWSEMKHGSVKTSISSDVGWAIRKSFEVAKCDG